MRPVLLSALMGLAACGAPTVETPEAPALPTGGPIQADPSTRQRLAPAQLLAFFPDSLETLPARAVILAGNGSEADPVSGVSVQYGKFVRTQSRSGWRGVAVRVWDLIDAPDVAASEREAVETEHYAGLPFRTDTSYTFTDMPAVTAQMIARMPPGPPMINRPTLRAWIADRFLVQIHPIDDGVSRLESSEVEAFFRESDLPRLAEAPDHAQAGDRPVSAWAAGRLDSLLNRPARPLASPPTSPLQPDCEVLLPPAVVAMATGVPDRTPDDVVQTETACALRYSASFSRPFDPHNEASPPAYPEITIRVARYPTPGYAARALDVAINHHRTDSLRTLEDLDGAAYVYAAHVAGESAGAHVLQFRSGQTFVSMVSEAGTPINGFPPIALRKLEDLARGVEAGLVAAAPASDPD